MILICDMKQQQKDVRIESHAHLFEKFTIDQHKQNNEVNQLDVS